ncbi:MAG: alpha/beta fold hydrolase [Acidimicrobiales bacterium]
MTAHGRPAGRPEDLAGISVPTTLVWGRHDRIAPLRTAEATSARYGWPCTGHFSPGEQPEALLGALRAALATS